MAKVERVVESSAIEKVAYDYETRSLFITFKSGGTYEYDNIGIDLFEGLVNAKSVGRFYHAHIRGI